MSVSLTTSSHSFGVIACHSSSVSSSVTEPQELKATENFMEITAMRVFVMATMKWMSENKNFRYNISIKKVYFDIDQNWMWTTFIVTDEDTDEEWQAMNQNEWLEVVNETDNGKLTDLAWKFMDKLAKRK
jgi:hypothetical protein